MAIDVKVKVDGLKELTRQLTKELPAKTGPTIIRRSIRKSFDPMLKAAKLKAGQSRHISSGALQASIGMFSKRPTRSKKTAARLVIAPRRSDKKALQQYLDFYDRAVKPQTFLRGISHGHFVEFGVPSRGIPANPFMRPAFDMHGRSGISEFDRIYKLEVEKAILKSRKAKAK